MEKHFHASRKANLVLSDNSLLAPHLTLATFTRIKTPFVEERKRKSSNELVKFIKFTCQPRDGEGLSVCVCVSLLTRLLNENMKMFFSSFRFENRAL